MKGKMKNEGKEEGGGLMKVDVRVGVD